MLPVTVVSVSLSSTTKLASQALSQYSNECRDRDVRTILVNFLGHWYVALGYSNSHLSIGSIDSYTNYHCFAAVGHIPRIVYTGIVS